MPTSIRIIRVLNDEYTVEVETEVEDSTELLGELMKTLWGRKMAWLLQQMLPDVPEYHDPSVQEQIEKEEKEMKEHEEKLRQEGYDKAMTEIKEKFGDNPEELVKNTEKGIRKKYMKFIRVKHLKLKEEVKSDKLPCFGHWGEPREGEDVNHPFVLFARCSRCQYNKECRGRKFNNGNQE